MYVQIKGKNTYTLEMITEYGFIQRLLFTKLSLIWLKAGSMSCPVEASIKSGILKPVTLNSPFVRTYELINIIVRLTYFKSPSYNTNSYEKKGHNFLLKDQLLKRKYCNT